MVGPLSCPRRRTEGSPRGRQRSRDSVRPSGDELPVDWAIGAALLRGGPGGRIMQTSPNSFGLVGREGFRRTGPHGFGPVWPTGFEEVGPMFVRRRSGGI